MGTRLHQILSQISSQLKLLIPTLYCVLFTSTSVLACSCIYSKTIKEEINKRTLIFKGIPISSDTVGIMLKFGQNDTIYAAQIRFKFIVERSFKGENNSDTVTVITGMGGGDCGFPFKVGEKYLVFAYTENVQEFDLNLYKHIKKNMSLDLKIKSSIYFQTNICTLTSHFRNEAESILVKELAQLNDGS